MLGSAGCVVAICWSRRLWWPEGVLAKGRRLLWCRRRDRCLCAHHLLVVVLLMLMLGLLMLMLLVMLLCGYRGHARSVGRRRKRWKLLVHLIWWRIQPFAQ